MFNERRASAVEYRLADGKNRVALLRLAQGSGEGLGNRAAVKNAVVLTAGAIMTPKILANSGIAENGHVADLPGVGKNLQDHPVVGVIYRVEAEVAQRAPDAYTISEQVSFAKRGEQSEMRRTPNTALYACTWQRDAAL